MTNASMILIGMYDSPFVRRVAVSMNLLECLRTPQLVRGQGFRQDPAPQPAGPRTGAGAPRWVRADRVTPAATPV
jgi:hypothetical protein